MIETVLTHLELGGVLRPLGSFYANYQFRLLEPEATVLASHTPERQAFLRRLLRYFGEQVGPAGSDEARGQCGSCTSCEEKSGTGADFLSAGTAERSGLGNPLPSPFFPREIPVSAVPEITAAQAAAIEGLVAECRPSLGSARQLARFLCGLTSPATSRERLGRHAGFGLLARVPFATVLARAESLAGSGLKGHL